MGIFANPLLLNSLHRIHTKPVFKRHFQPIECLHLLRYKLNIGITDSDQGINYVSGLDDKIINEVYP